MDKYKWGWSKLTDKSSEHYFLFVLMAVSWVELMVLCFKTFIDRIMAAAYSDYHSTFA
ncbi:hypothetical protein [Arcticibacterium luteifluviistationis]|uniref:hypothetical protein n=1 Tax=Arcticibacterium luteifluviistationis TaxID=1784714 RepID=UPI0013A69127|nr:hypothetical protein [Arcticibacterium luteifluviistationis]